VKVLDQLDQLDQLDRDGFLGLEVVVQAARRLWPP
jgi:hypothetical protein